jgi:hypothetical protein
MSYSDDQYAAQNAPLDVSSEELRKSWRLPFMFAGTVPTGATAMVAPAYQDEQGQTHGTYPLMGFANDIYARFGRLLPGIASFALNKGVDPEVAYANPDVYKNRGTVEIPPIPGTETAEKNVKDAERWAEANVPRPQPQNPQEAQWAAAGERVGEAISPILPMKAVDALGAAGGALRWFAPTLHDAPVVAGLTTGLLAAGGATDKPSEAKEPKWEVELPQTAQQAADTAKPAAATSWSVDTSGALPGALHAAPPPSNVGMEQGTTPAWQVGAEVAAGLTAAWFGLKYGPRAINVTSDALRGIERDPAVVSKLLDDVTAGRAVPDKIPAMPLPNDASGVTRRMAQSQLNQNAILDELAKGVTDSKAEADALIAKNHQINQAGTMNTRMEHQFRSGVSPSGRVGPSMMDNKIMVDQMTPAQQQLADNLAWAKNEWSNRTDPTRGGTPLGGGDPLTFRNYDDNTIRSMIAQGEADPAVKAWYDHWKSTKDFVLDDAYQSSLITKSQYDQAQKLYQHWMPTVAQDGQIIHSWNPRSAGQYTGWELPPIKAWDAQASYYDSVYRDMTRNAWQRDWMNRLQSWTQNNPEYRGLIREVPAPHAETLDIATANGQRFFEVNNPWLRNSFKNPTTMAHALSWASKIRQMAQSASVGTMALAGGKFFAPIHMMRYMMGTAANLPREMYSGYIDRALRQSIGARIPGRFDPTAIPGIAAKAAQDVGSMFVKNMHDVLSNADHPDTRALKAFIGQSGVDSWRQWLNNRYMNTNLAARIEAGVSGGGGFGVRDVEPRQVGVKGAYARDPLHTVAPTVSNPSGLASRAPLSGPFGPLKRGLVASYIDLKSLARDIHSAILDSPNAWAYDINRPNPEMMTHGQLDKSRLAHYSQSVIGDPATHGTGAFAQSNAAKLMFYNIALQSGASTLRSFRDHPLTWAAGMISPLIMGSLAESISALVSGPEHVAHLEQHTSSQQKAANFFIYHGPGSDPNNHTEISLPQAARFLAPVIKELTHSFVGTWHALSDKSTYDKVVGAISEMFSHHVHTDLGAQMTSGAIDAAGFPIAMSPGATAAVTALGGKAPGNIPATIAENVNQNRPALGGMLSPSSQASIPGQEGGANEMSKSTWDALRGTLHSVFGIASDALINAAHNSGKRWDATHDPSWVLRGLASDYAQNTADQNRWGNILWNKQLPTSTRGPIDERVDRALDSLKATQNAAKDLQFQGLTRKGGEQLPVVRDNPVPEDPTMRSMYLSMSRTHAALSKTLLPQISDIYKQLETLKDTPMMAEEKRRLADDLTYKLTAKKQQVWGQIESLNDQLSYMAGGRHVDVSKPIHWGKGVEQFHE